MKTFKILLALLFLVTSSCDNKTEKSDGVFKKLGYDPRWEEIPSIEEFKEVFFKTTGQRFDDKVNDCAYELIHSEKEHENFLRKYEKKTLKITKRRFDSIIYNYAIKLYGSQDEIDYFKNICFNSLLLDLNYRKKGNKLNCKRSEFFRSLIEDGSSWLLRNNYSKEIIDNWFGNKYLVSKNTKIDNLIGTIYDPFIVKQEILKPNQNIIYYEDPKYAPLCKAVAENYGYLFYEKIDVKDKIKLIKKDFNIAQSNVDLEDSIEKDYIIELDYNNDGKKELIHRTYLYGEPEKGHPEDNSYYGELGIGRCEKGIYSNYDTTFNREFLTSYEDNIEEVKKYLKTPNLVVKDLEHFNSIKEKFGGKDIDYECLYRMIDLAESYDFFTFKGKSYIKYYHSHRTIFILINGKEYSVVGYLSNLHPEKFDSKELIVSDYIKSYVASNFPIYYVNEDDYLYDKSLLDEIKKISYKADLIEKVQEYLKQKAKTICDVDLDNLQYEPENKVIVLKLMEDKDEDIALDKTKVIKNSEIPDEQKICGLNEENEECTLYILNNSDKEMKARYFYILASKETGTSQRELMYLNDEYSDTIIKPNHFAEINIPIPDYLFYLEGKGEMPCFKDFL